MGAIATRVALAIDNALLFEEERHTAESFQKYLLPRALPQLDGLQIAVRYYPAAPLASHGQGIQTQVGGDWYDVIPLSAGRVGIVIGDVEGRGAKAAAIMGQLRAALRAFAQDDKSPADILARLDEWTRIIATPEQDDKGGEVSIPPIVTCQYLVYDAWSRQLSFANAGHAPPLLLVDGECRELEIEEVGQPLGVRAKGLHADLVYKEETVSLPPGAALLLYTDGLVDRRPGRDGSMPSEEETLGTLCAELTKVSGAEVERIADAATVAVPGEIDDDMAILVVRSSDVDLDVEARTFPAQPIMVGEARRMAAEAFADWNVPEERAELACLLVSEVVTNVVLHAAAAGGCRAGSWSSRGRRCRSRSPGTCRASKRRPSATRSSRCGCAGVRSRSGSRCSTRTCGCPASAARGRTTRAGAAFTWSTSSPGVGDRVPPGKAKPSGSRFPRAAGECSTGAVTPPLPEGSGFSLSRFPSLAKGRPCPENGAGRVHVGVRGMPARRAGERGEAVVLRAMPASGARAGGAGGVHRDQLSTGVGHVHAVAGGDRRGDTQVDAGRRAGGGQRRGGHVVARHDHIPARAFPLHADRLDPADHRAVLVDADVPDMGGERPPALPAGVVGADVLQLGRLVTVTDAHSGLGIGRTPVLQRGVVQRAMVLQTRRQHPPPA
ncbi:hypothetical protein GCM10020001_056470 [Nonomuraea salmonea]